MEFDDLIKQLEQLRVDAQRERFSAVAHQLQAWIGYLTMRPLTFSRRDPEIYSGPVPGEEE